MKLDYRDRRAYMRKEFALRRNILVNEKREARLKDISLGGACFLSEEAHDVGTEIIVGNHLMSLLAHVVNCRPDTAQNDHGPMRGHEVRCKYIPSRQLLQEEILMELVDSQENTLTA